MANNAFHKYCNPLGLYRSVEKMRRRWDAFLTECNHFIAEHFYRAMHPHGMLMQTMPRVI
jgi:hypothetical protein